MSKCRASAEVADLIAKLMADADALKTKYADSDMPPEDAETLENMVAQLEALSAEQAQAVASERMEAVRSKMNEPRTPAPKLPAQVRQHDRTASVGEGLALWLGEDRSPENAYRARLAGFDLGNPRVRVPVDYGTLNRKRRASQRTILSKGGSGTGADYVWVGYSDKVVEYLTYFSPVLGLLDSETTADGNQRTYFVVDDTSMESTYVTASSGSETNPTIPDTNLATANVVVNVFDITSGLQKVTHNELRDSYISLEDKIAKANSNSHARKMEREILTATGNGTTGVQGITAACTSSGTPSAWSQDAILDGLWDIPVQYRANAIFVSNDTTRNDINVALRDDIGRSLFERTVEDEQEVDMLFGKKFYVSSYVASNVLLIFVPEFYKLRLVSGQLFQQFTERYWPHIGYAGIMAFGGAWIGPSSAARKVTKT